MKKGYRMWLYFIFTTLVFFEKNVLAESQNCCASNEKIFQNLTCTDNADVNLTCKLAARVFEQKNELSIDVDETGVLHLTEVRDKEDVQIKTAEFCLGIDYENDTELALICMDEPTETVNIGLRVLSYLRILCAVASVVFFFTIAVIYICMPELRDIEGISIINFSITFGISHLLQGIGPVIIYYFDNYCDPFSFINNFAVLCSYNWLTVMSLHIWRITIRPIFHTQMNWVLIYLVYGYGFPTILLITSLISHLTQPFNPIFEKASCHLEGSVIVWFYFYGPIVVLVFLSSIIQLWAAKKLWIDVDRRDHSNSIVRLRKKCLMYLHLLLVAGSMIILELSLYPLSPIDDLSLNYVLTLVECRDLLLGGVVFFILVLLRNKVLRALAKNGLWFLEFPSKWKKLIDEEEEIDKEPETEETTLTRYL